MKRGRSWNLPLHETRQSGRFHLRSPRLLQAAQHVLRTERQFIDPHPCGVEDRVGDGGHGRDAGDFAGAFGAVGAGAPG
jgi:hypothetical protein